MVGFAWGVPLEERDETHVGAAEAREEILGARATLLALGVGDNARGALLVHARNRWVREEGHGGAWRAHGRVRSGGELHTCSSKNCLRREHSCMRWEGGAPSISIMHVSCSTSFSPGKRG